MLRQDGTRNGFANAVGPVGPAFPMMSAAMFPLDLSDLFTLHRALLKIARIFGNTYEYSHHSLP